MHLCVAQPRISFQRLARNEWTVARLGEAHRRVEVWQQRQVALLGRRVKVDFECRHFLAHREREATEKERRHDLQRRGVAGRDGFSFSKVADWGG